VDGHGESARSCGGDSQGLQGEGWNDEMRVVVPGIDRGGENRRFAPREVNCAFPLMDL
jgi:hypothetical protein